MTTDADIQIADLPDCTDLWDDDAALRSFFNENGYLYLKGVLPLRIVEGIRDQLVEALLSQGAVRVGDQPNALKLTKPVDVMQFHSTVDYSSLFDDPEINAVYERLFGTPVWVWRSVIIRAIAPSVEAYRAIPHQDGVFADSSIDFRIFWVPLTEMDSTVGPLAFVPGSHRAGLQEHVLGGTKMAFGGEAQFRTVPADRIPGTWASPTHLKPGDVLVHHPHMIHQGLPNRAETDLLRMSLDYRIQPLDATRVPNSFLTVPESRRLVVGEDGHPSHARPEASILL